MNALVLGCAYAMDLIAGDPEWLPHPVRAMGRMIAAGETVATPGRHAPVRDLIQGAVVTAVVVAATAAAAVAALRAARLIHPGVALAVEALLAWTVLATGSLLREATRVIHALDGDDIVSARVLLARIVGRDTATLTESEVARGVIETLAESTCDAIVAPLCFLAAGGVPAGLAYKAVNTLDSMIGHREPPYTYFGRVAARLDDIANWIPARLAAAAIAIAAACTGNNGAGALRLWRRDHRNHDSPNAGHPEAAMAGALGVRLGGTNFYDGMAVSKPLIGAGNPAPGIDAARAACRIVTAASLVTFMAALLGALAWHA
ncbi:MAG TPA: adenosylcobinamide-phosphate synthase CbiB [Vicinamibacterales bacterium]|nr:adenosylcobinamide-phosphate synthase CbiB [Vicinamibacterales bacterium]